MARYRITTPQAEITAEIAGVVFVKGVAEVDGADPGQRRALAYFRNADYGVQLVDEAPAVDGQPAGTGAPAEPMMPARNGSTDEWRAYAKAQGMPADQADALGRDALAAHYTQEVQP